MRFPFTAMTARARKDPLGHPTLNLLKANTNAVDAVFLNEHDSAGAHNTTEVPRTLGKFVWGGATYTTTMFNGNYISLTNPAVGEIDVTLKGAGHFNYPGMAPLVNISTTDGKPYLGMVEVVSATSLKLRLQKLTSALGGGNAWAATDVSCDLAVCTPGLMPSPTGLNILTDWQRRDFLHPEASGLVPGWDSLVENQGRLRKEFLAEHDTSGNHNAVEIAREWGYCTYGGGAYTLAAGTVASVLKSATGVVDVTLTSAGASTSKMAAFGTVQGATKDELWSINLVPNTTAKMRAYLYQYDFANKWWTAADGNFSLWIYTAP